MNPNMKNHRGFALIESLLILILAGIIGGTGWYVYQSYGKAQDTLAKADAINSATINKKPTTKSDKFEFLTYKNSEYGFKVSIPKTFLSDYGVYCTKETNSYRPTRAEVPATVIQIKNKFYLTEKYTYQLTGESEEESLVGVATFSGCRKIIASADVIKQYLTRNGFLEDGTSLLLSVMPIYIFNVKDRQSLLSDIKQIFTYSKTIEISSIDADKSGEWENVNIRCTPELSCNGYKYYLRYFQSKNKLVYIEMGQSPKFPRIIDGKSYDNQIADSLRLL